MRKTMFILASMAILPTIHAYEYPYLTFENTDGTKMSVAVESLVLTINDGHIVATNTNGSLPLPLSTLGKMYFSTSGSTGINANDIQADEEVEAYSTTGVSMGKYDNITAARQSLPCGIYLIKTKRATQKITVK